AQVPGQVGGDALTGLSNRNLPAVLPFGSVTVDYPAHTYITHETLATASITAATGASPVTNLQQGLKNDLTAAPNAKTFSVSQPNSGGGLPVSNL
ncbi:hypothetical protein ABTI98_19065, partial [Acinetobacter baumannii]